MTVYMVTYNSFIGSYGTNVSLLGIYETEDEAKNAIEKAGKQLISLFPEDETYYRPYIEEDLKNDKFFGIDAVELGKVPELTVNIDFEEIHGGLYLDGYIE